MEEADALPKKKLPGKILIQVAQDRFCLAAVCNGFSTAIRRLLYHMCREWLAEDKTETHSPQSPFGPFNAPSPGCTCAETLAYLKSLRAEEEPEVRTSV